MSRETAKLSIFGFGLAIGIIWGIGMLLIGLLGWSADYGLAFINAIGSIYIGFEATLLGSIIGGIWGLIDGFVCGVLVAWLYNCFSCCGCKDKSSSK